MPLNAPDMYFDLIGLIRWCCVTGVTGRNRFVGERGGAGKGRNGNDRAIGNRFRRTSRKCYAVIRLCNRQANRTSIEARPRLNSVSPAEKQNCRAFSLQIADYNDQVLFFATMGTSGLAADVKIRLESCNNKVQRENFNADGKSIVESPYGEMTERSLFLVDSHNII